MANYLVTGCSRGIGLYLVTELASLPTAQIGTIFATARSESPALQELIKGSAGRVVFVKLDVADENNVKGAAKEVESKLDGKGLDVLVNNAGIMGIEIGGVVKMDGDSLMNHFQTNVLGVHLVTRTFLPLLQKGKEKKIVNISSTVGSIGLQAKFAHQPTPEYKVSKAALNMLTVQYAFALDKDRFTVFALSPGYLKTQLAGPTADLEVEVGVHAVLQKVQKARREDNGKFLDIFVEGWELYNGANPPW